MIRHDTFLFYTREYLHAVKNGKGHSESASIATVAAKDFYFKHTHKTERSDKLQEWADIYGYIINFDLVASEIDFEADKIPPKKDMPKLEIET